MSKSKKELGLTLGAVPRADLLPPEIKQDVVAKAQRRALGFGVVLVVVLVAAAYAFVSLVEQTSQAKLIAAEERTAALIAEQAKFVEAGTIKAQIEAIKKAQIDGSSTQSDWELLLDEVEDVRPSAVEYYSMTMNSETPVTLFPQSTLPRLEPARSGDVTFTFTSKKFRPLVTMLERLQRMPGFVDATPTEAFFPYKDAGPVYGMTIVMHFDGEIRANQFVAPTEVVEGEEADGDAAEGETENE